MKPQTQEVHGTLPEDIPAAPDTEGPKNLPEHPGPFSPGRCRKLCADAPRKADSHGDSAWSTAWPGGQQGSQNGVAQRAPPSLAHSPRSPCQGQQQMRNENSVLPAGFLLPQGDPPATPTPTQHGQARALPGGPRPGQYLPQGCIWPSWRHSWVSQLGRILLTSTGTSTHDPAHPVRHRPPPPRHASPCWGSPDGERARGRACDHFARPPPRQRLQLGAPTLGLVPCPGENLVLGTEAFSGGPRGLGEPRLRGLHPRPSGPWAVLLLLQTGKSRSERDRGVLGWGLPPARPHPPGRSLLDSSRSETHWWCLTEPAIHSGNNLVSSVGNRPPAVLGSQQPGNTQGGGQAAGPGRVQSTCCVHHPGQVPKGRGPPPGPPAARSPGRGPSRQRRQGELLGAAGCRRGRPESWRGTRSRGGWGLQECGGTGTDRGGPGGRVSLELAGKARVLRRAARPGAARENLSGRAVRSRPTPLCQVTGGQGQRAAGRLGSGRA